MGTLAPIWLTAAAAVIAAIIALAGVVVGQWMQRKTTRLQLEEQRRRDAELWKREDRYRFAEAKRNLYVKFLAESVGFEELVGQRALKDSLAGKRVASDRFEPWLEQWNLLVAEHNKLIGLLAEIQLVADEDVNTKAEQLASRLEDASEQQRMDDGKPESVFEYIEDSRLIRKDLKEAMRAELASQMEYPPSL
jgi:hypothetical protein